MYTMGRKEDITSRPYLYKILLKLIHYLLTLVHRLLRSP